MLLQVGVKESVKLPISHRLTLLGSLHGWSQIRAHHIRLPEVG